MGKVIVIRNIIIGSEAIHDWPTVFSSVIVYVLQIFVVLITCERSH